AWGGAPGRGPPARRSRTRTCLRQVGPLAARSGHQRRTAEVVDDLRVDVPRAPEHGQARPSRVALHALPDPVAANAPPLVLVVTAAHVVAPAAVFPALRRMYSFSYLIPLPW